MAKPKKIVKYFGWATNADKDMMAHMVGRKYIIGVPATLLGYEACIQKSSEMRTEIPKTSPFKKSPRQIILDVWGENFYMYVTRPNPSSKIKGTIWDLTSEELELVKEWECVEYGLQDEVKAIAVDEQGRKFEVEIQTLLRSTDKIHKVLGEDNFETYIAPKDKMLAIADKTRLFYLKGKQGKFKV